MDLSNSPYAIVISVTILEYTLGYNYPKNSTIQEMGSISRMDRFPFFKCLWPEFIIVDPFWFEKLPEKGFYLTTEILYFSHFYPPLHKLSQAGYMPKGDIKKTQCFQFVAMIIITRRGRMANAKWRKILFICIFYWR